MKAKGGVLHILPFFTPLVHCYKKTHQIALSYLLHNYAIAFKTDEDMVIVNGLSNLCLELLSVKQDEESMFRLLVTVGTLHHKYKIDTSKILALEPTLSIPTGTPCREVFDTLRL